MNSLKLLKGLTIALVISLIVNFYLLGQTYWKIHSPGGWRDQAYSLSSSWATELAMKDFRQGRLRLYEMAGENDAPKFSGRQDGQFEVWHPQYLPLLGEAHLYSTEQFIESYNSKMRYMVQHPEKFQIIIQKKD